MVIQCASFLIRLLQPSDKESLALHANNRKIWRNLRNVFPHPYTLRDAEQFLELARTDKETRRFCIDCGGACAGVVGFFPQPDVYSRSMEIGYWLGEPFWGRGIMSEAVEKLSRHIFLNSDIVRIHAGIFEWNTPSMKVLEKAGYRFEGIFEKSVFKDGALISEHRYALLKD